MITAINSEADYKAALTAIEQLIDAGARAGTADGDKLKLLSLLVQDYEQKRFELAPPDPVEAIKFRMDQMNLSPRDLVPLLGSRSKVSEILSRKRPLTLSMVRALHKGLGIPAKSLLEEQFLFDIREEALEWDRFPVEEMAARGWIKGRILDGQHRIATLRAFFQQLGPTWAASAMYKQTKYVRSARPMNSYALLAWKARVCLRALETPPPIKYDRSLNLNFLHELAHLSILSDGPRHAKEYVEKLGISLIIEPHLPETYIDGAAILLKEDHPVIGLTIRHDRIDNFWFVLMHELVHVWRHLGSELTEVYDDLDVDDVGNSREREADTLAGEALVPKAEWEKSPARNLRTTDAVNHLARKLRIHPAIVAGRIRHHYKSYRVLNRLVGQGEVRRLFPELASVEEK